MISVISPSRHRADETLASLKSLNLKKNGLEALIWVDNDDPELNKYKKYFGANPNIKLYIKKRVGYINFHKMVNFLASKASGDWLILWNDDVYMDNPDWFKIFKNFTRNFVPTWQPIVINIWGQGVRPNNLFPIVSKKYVDILGHFSQFAFCDDWITKVATEANISFDLKGIKPKHRKYGGENPLKDKTFREVEKDRIEIKKVQNPSNKRYLALMKKDINKIVKFNQSISLYLFSSYVDDASYLPVLIKALQITNGPVLELGSGISGSPVLHWLCLEGKRRHVTYENNPQVYQLIKKFVTSRHSVEFVQDWDSIPIENDHWSVVLVDHIPFKRRKIEIKRLANKADFIITHDTEPQRDPEFEYAKEVFPLFKYRYNYQRQRPYTAVLSNFVDFQKAIIKHPK